MVPASPAPMESSRLILRLVEVGDLPALFEVYSDDEVTRFLPNPTWKTPADGQVWFDRILKRRAEGSALELAIVEKATGLAIGVCLLFAFEEASGRAEMGYVLGRRHWRSGLMKEALSTLLDFAFRNLGLRKVEAHTDPVNIPSGEILLRLGFTREGLLRQHAMIKGELKDKQVYGILRQEWEVRRAGTSLPPAAAGG